MAMPEQNIGLLPDIKRLATAEPQLKTAYVEILDINPAFSTVARPSNCSLSPHWSFCLQEKIELRFLFDRISPESGNKNWKNRCSDAPRIG
jgi:hypothetical protein